MAKYTLKAETGKFNKQHREPWSQNVEAVCEFIIMNISLTALLENPEHRAAFLADIIKFCNVLRKAEK